MTMQYIYPILGSIFIYYIFEYVYIYIYIYIYIYMCVYIYNVYFIYIMYIYMSCNLNITHISCELSTMTG